MKKIKFICDPYLYWNTIFLLYPIGFGGGVVFSVLSIIGYIENKWNSSIASIIIFALFSIGLFINLIVISPRISRTIAFTEEGVEIHAFWRRKKFFKYEDVVISWGSYFHSTVSGHGSMRYFVTVSTRCLVQSEKVQINQAGTDVIRLSYRKKKMKKMAEYLPEPKKSQFLAVCQAIETEKAPAYQKPVKTKRKYKKPKKTTFHK